MSPADKGPRLGRGLAALLGEAAAATPSAEGVREIAVGLLEPSPFQPRRAWDEAALQELAESIAARGVLQPLLVRPHPGEAGRYQIIAGERRWRAALRAGLAEVPCLVRSLSDLDAAAAALVENLQRQDLNAIEEGEGYRRLMDEFGLQQEDLAGTIGKSRSHIANTLRLLHLPEPVVTALREGRISAGHARALLSHQDPVAGLEAILARGLNVRQVEALRGQPGLAETMRAPGKPAWQKDANTRAIEQSLAEMLGLRVAIKPGARGGSLTVYYKTLEQLDDVILRLERRGEG